MSCRRRRPGGTSLRRRFSDAEDNLFPRMNVYRCYHPGSCNNDCILLDPDDERPGRGCRGRR